MRLEEIFFWGIIAIAAVVFIIIFNMLMSDFRKLMQKSDVYSEFLAKSKTLCFAPPKQHNEVFVGIITDSEFSDILTEMKTLSELIRMPVCTIVNKKKLRITPNTDINNILNHFQENINIKNDGSNS